MDGSTVIVNKAWIDDRWDQRLSPFAGTPFHSNALELFAKEHEVAVPGLSASSYLGFVHDFSFAIFEHDKLISG